MRRGAAFCTAGLCGLATVGLTACDSLLEVENVANIEAGEVRNAQSAELWANGSLHAAQQGWDNLLTLLSAASDELRFVGAHGWWGELDRGDLSRPGNSGLNSMYPGVASALWFVDEAIFVLDSLRQAGDLTDSELLARAYLYGAIMYASVADGLEDYAPGHLREPGPAIGTESMGSFYETAVEYATAGLALQPGDTVARDLLGARARARHAHGVWRRIRPPPADVSGGGLVSVSDAAADAQAALAADPTDWQLEFEFAREVVASSTLAQTNCFPNLRAGDRYVQPLPDNRGAESVLLIDPIDGVPDPSLERTILVRLVTTGACRHGTLIVFSAREMHLIIAEDALARADMATFATHVNHVRSEEGLSDWTDASGAAREMLIYERQTRLFMTGRRLADMYRFGIQSDSWDPTSAAATVPGTLFPIPSSEIEANCYLNGGCG